MATPGDREGRARKCPACAAGSVAPLRPVGEKANGTLLPTSVDWRISGNGAEHWLPMPLRPTTRDRHRDFPEPLIPLLQIATFPFLCWCSACWSARDALDTGGCGST